MALEFSVTADARAITAGLSDLARKQIPIATAVALNTTATLIREAERQNMSDVLDHPTPFTLKGVVIVTATKERQKAVVKPMDKQADYLAPEEFNTPQALGNKKAIWTPVNARLNQYGNIPAATMKKWASNGDPNVFIGIVKTKSGKLVDGVWKRFNGQKGKKGQRHLQLLVRLTKPVHVKTRLEWHEIAEKTLNEKYKAAFDRAMQRALKAKRGQKWAASP